MATSKMPYATGVSTFLFTDVEGSTKLWQQFPNAMQTALARHDDLLRTAVEVSHGHVIKSTGDGFFAVFNAATDAVQACILAQRGLQGETWGQTGPLRVRMGLHSGEAQERGGDYFGTAINRAARVMAAASGGQVLLSSDAADTLAGHLPEGASLRDLGEHRLKDLQRPEHIFQLVYPGLAADFPAIGSLNRLPNNLPSQPSVFVGRQTELGDIKELLAADPVRMLTLTGPGGTGKTRLALQAAAELSDRFDDGTYFVDLAPIRDPGSVLATIARTVGLKESSNGSMVEELGEQLRDKDLLLLLDNFEQVTPAAVQVAELIRICPHLKMLTTSREALHVRGERLYPVPPLGIPPASTGRIDLRALAQNESVQLFVERAREVKPDFELSEENAEAVVELCNRLDGLPLAIELAAVRIRLFSPQMLRKRIGDRFKLLQGGARDLPQRQQTLYNAIEWSYDLLSEPEKAVFSVLSVFAGCTFDAAETVVSEMALPRMRNVDIGDVLVSLIDKSLLRFLDADETEPRLRMLETIREFAADQLVNDAELHEAVCEMHARFYAGFVQRQWQRMVGHEREAAMQDMAADVENLRIAWSYWVDKSDMEQLHRMTDGLWNLYDVRGWYQSTVLLITDLLAILSRTPDTAEQARQEILLQISLARALMAFKGLTPDVEDTYSRALALSEEYGEVPQLFPVLRGLSTYYMYRAEFDKGAQIGERILALAESLDDDFMRVHGYLVLASNIGFLETYAEGRALADKGIALFERIQQSVRPYQLGSNPGIVCYTTSAFFAYWDGFADDALVRANRAIELATQFNHPFTLAYALFHTGALHLWRGDIERAMERAQAMLRIAEEYGFQFWVPLSTMLLGITQCALGQSGEGLSNVEQAFTRYQGLKSPPVFYPPLIGMRSQAFALAGRPGEGLAQLTALIEEMGEESLLRSMPQLFIGKADMLLAASPEKEADVISLLRKLLFREPRAGGRLLALQAATRLCRLEMRSGNAEESGSVLAEIYDSFSEGFLTADLIEAKEVLTQWRNR